MTKLNMASWFKRARCEIQMFESIVGVEHGAERRKTLAFLEAAHEDSILGPVFKCIIGDQFARIKKGDRFFYDLGIDNKIAFSLSQLNEVQDSELFLHCFYDILN